MSDATTAAEAAKRNGRGVSFNGADPLLAPVRGARGTARYAAKLARDLLEGAGDRLRGRLTADLDDRDPDFIREKLPLAWLLASLWFRGEVRNLGNIPEDRPVLLVGNHSGGNMTPDTLIFTLAFCTYFGVERPFYQLAHQLVLASPYGQFVRRFGTVTASHENAERALDAGAALLVYPGGDWEVHRPSWERNKVDFAGRKGFIKLAMSAGVPIVPVVSIGGQETALFLSQGGGLSRLLRLDKLLRAKVVPISIALPWIVNVGDLLGHIPLPAKITIEALPPIDIKEEFGSNPDVDEVYAYVTDVMQDKLSSLATERRLPVIG
jgi:1-acyl-sn-glycerol-3-phosphate acyltransferase